MLATAGALFVSTFFYNMERQSAAEVARNARQLGERATQAREQEEAAKRAQAERSLVEAERKRRAEAQQVIWV